MYGISLKAASELANIYKYTIQEVSGKHRTNRLFTGKVGNTERIDYESKDSGRIYIAETQLFSVRPWTHRRAARARMGFKCREDRPVGKGPRRRRRRLQRRLR